MDPQKWMQENWPNCRALDHDWTMERYDYPLEVRNWIKDNWIKVNDENGGTYHDPEYHKKHIQKHQLQQTPVKKSVENPEEAEEKDNNNGKAFAQAYKKTPFYDKMDDINKKGLDVMATEGMDAAIKHMFTDQKTGRQLSYGEMRMRYG